MFHSIMSNSPSASEEPNSSSGSRVQDFCGLTDSMLQNSIPIHPPQTTKKKRNLPGNPDPDAEVIALSPRTLMATNRFVCEICNKGFQRDQNLQLHRRGHNLPWKLKQRSNNQNKKRVYICPETTCVHHNASRALGDLTGIKKHFCRKHGEKKWKCEKCSKIYAVQSDWKAHVKTCGTREYRCDCGTVFSRKDSFVSHRAFCDALAEESARLTAATNSILAPNPNNNNTTSTIQSIFQFKNQYPPPPSSPSAPSLFPLSSHHRHFPNPWDPAPQSPNSHGHNQLVHNIKHEAPHNYIPLSSPLYQERSLMASPLGNLEVRTSAPALSATALLQKAATVGAAAGGHRSSTMAHLDMHVASTWHNDNDRFTRDFLGLSGSEQGEAGSGSGNLRDMVYDHRSMLKHQGLECAGTCSGGWANC